jgi:predicted  nucleic acid-binding Zn-ribbon protein
MGSLDLRRLWALHEADVEINEIKKRAAGLDVGQAEAQALQTLGVEDSKAYHDLLAAQADVDLQKQGAEDKLKKTEKTLYGGTIVNPREVATFEKEIEALNRQIESLGEKQAEINHQIPALKAKEDKLEAQRAELKKRQAAKIAAARELKPKLEAAYKAAVARRNEGVKAIPPALLAKYEGVKTRQGGIGMGKITPAHNCSACGTHLAERVINAVKEDRVVTCESCHRILYYTEGVL